MNTDPARIEFSEQQMVVFQDILTHLQLSEEPRGVNRDRKEHIR